MPVILAICIWTFIFFSTGLKFVISGLVIISVGILAYAFTPFKTFWRKNGETHKNRVEVCFLNKYFIQGHTLFCASEYGFLQWKLSVFCSSFLNIWLIEYLMTTKYKIKLKSLPKRSFSNVLRQRKWQCWMHRMPLIRKKKFSGW